MSVDTDRGVASESPYAPPAETSAAQGNYVGGVLARGAAVIVGLVFAALVLQFVLVIFFVVSGLLAPQEVTGPVLGNLIFLAILFALMRYLWRLGTACLHPESHGFIVREREQANAILKRHQFDPQVSAVETDDMYDGLTLRELIRTYHGMDREKHPGRVKSLLTAIGSHPDLN